MSTYKKLLGSYDFILEMKVFDKNLSHETDFCNFIFQLFDVGFNILMFQRPLEEQKGPPALKRSTKKGGYRPFEPFHITSNLYHYTHSF